VKNIFATAGFLCIVMTGVVSSLWYDATTEPIEQPQVPVRHLEKTKPRSPIDYFCEVNRVNPLCRRSPGRTP
jgi:hypothetical protein